MTLDTARIELDDEHSDQLKKYTAQQLRYVVNRLTFPEETSTACAASAGYPAAHSDVRASEINRKPHVRQMLNRCDSRPLDVTEDEIEEMTVKRLIAWHVKVVHSPRAAIREQQASAIEIARLKGYHKTAGEQEEGINYMDALIAMKEERLAEESRTESCS